jgi:hypothetical protein
MGRGTRQLKKSIRSKRVADFHTHFGLSIVSGKDLGPQLHTTRSRSHHAPAARHYRAVNDASYIDTIPYGGFWTEVDDSVGHHSPWAHQKEGSTYRLIPKPESRILVVDSVKSAELLLSKYPAAFDKDIWDQPFTISMLRLQELGFDGIRVTKEVVAERTTIFDMWDHDSVFWFTKVWPFLSKTKLLEHKPINSSYVI